MKCMYCGNLESKVIDSRSTEDGLAIRRRRECLECGKRFTTYEKIETMPLVVIKKDKTRQQFDRDKLLNGIMRACEKRPVSFKQMEDIVNEIENIIRNTLNNEISTEEIGTLVMSKLKLVDDVSYVRFASVYREFKDVNTFMDELKKILKER